MSKRSVLSNGLKVRVDCCDQLGRDHLRIDPIAPFGDRRAQRDDPAFGAKFASEANFCARGCQGIGARQEGHVTKFGNWASNFRSAAFSERALEGALFLPDV